MFLNKLQVTNYTFDNSDFTLKEVEMSFDSKFTPSIFPIGSLQGAGKSTLLKLLYTHLLFQKLTPIDDRRVKLEVSNVQKGRVYLIMQDWREGLHCELFNEGHHTYDIILSNYKQVQTQGSLAQQKVKALLEYLSTIKDSIVLLDNPDIGLHPDQQYKLCRDLEDLKSNNQFIVATHSYHFCEALTPAHVKELIN